MNFQQLEYVLAVHQLKHFSRAAEKCHVTQATLSGMIKKLEEELGVVLFDRDSHPILTTPQGEEVVELAQRMLNDRDVLLHVNRDFGNRAVEGTLRIGIIPTIANALLPITLKGILADHPGLNLHLEEITTEQMVQQLKMDQIDAGIMATPYPQAQLEEQILYYEAMFVYGVQKRHREFVLPEDLRSEPVWLLEEGHCFRNQALTICNVQEKALRPLNFQYRAGSFDTLMGLAESFGGYTLLPELYVASLPRKRRQRCMPFRIPVPVREVSLVHVRKYARLHLIEAVAHSIRQRVVPQLSTSHLRASEQDIIGI
jgi:LysR family hydrogen peroxide-inducible transcriptional activator